MVRDLSKQKFLPYCPYSKISKESHRKINCYLNYLRKSKLGRILRILSKDLVIMMIGWGWAVSDFRASQQIKFNKILARKLKLRLRSGTGNY